MGNYVVLCGDMVWRYYDTLKGARAAIAKNKQYNLTLYFLFPSE